MTTPPPSRLRRCLRVLLFLLLSLVGLAVAIGALSIAWIIWLLISGQVWDEGKNTRDLPNGLYVHETPDGVWICRDPNATLVAPSSFEVWIDAMAVAPPYVIGHAMERTGLPGPVGYFVLDMRTDELVEGLTEAAWVEEMAKREIALPTELHPPPGE